MEVQSALTNAATSQRSHASKGTEGGKKLGKQDFLNLMMTQMSHQDPLDPMDTDKMMQQFTAMGTVEQLQNLNSKVDNMLVSQNDIVQSSIYSYIGKDVELDSKSIHVQGGKATPAFYNLGGDAEKVIINIIDNSGSPIRTLEQDGTTQGTHQIEWDGRDSDGDRVSDQAYRYNVIAKTADGRSVPVQQIKIGRVSGVRFDGVRPEIKINDEYMPVDNIRSLNNQSSDKFDDAALLPLKNTINPMLLKQPLGLNTNNIK